MAKAKIKTAKRGTGAAAKRYQAVADALVKEAGVKKVEFHEKGLEGKAYLKQDRILVPPPTTLRRLYIFAHECAHIALNHKKHQPKYRKEYQAEQWAHKAFERHGLTVPEKSTESSKNYVAWKIHQAVRRGAKTIDQEVLDWCEGQLSPATVVWMTKQGKSAGKDKTTSSNRKGKNTKEDKVAALITAGADITKLVAGEKKEDLTAWFNLYLAVEVEQGSATHRAKVGDFQWFLKFFFAETNGYRRSDWLRGITKTFTTWIQKQKSDRTGKKLAATSCRRIIDSVKTVARWIHRQEPFMGGDPFHDIRLLQIDDPEWQGLSDLEVRRMKTAAEQLVHVNTRSDQMPLRNFAMILTLFDAGLRTFELAERELDDYHDLALHNIQRKGRHKVTNMIPLSKQTCEAIDAYIEKERPDVDGRLFLSRNGKAIDQSVIYRTVVSVAAYANSKLSKDEQIKVNPHKLRHTALRKWAETRDVRYALQVSGHTTDRYIWQYTEPSKDQMREAADELWS